MTTRTEGLQIETLENGPFMENCYLVYDERACQGLLIDPGDDDQRICERIKALNLTIPLIVATHGHIDHVGAIALLKRLLGAEFAIHPADELWLSRLPHQAAAFGLPTREIPKMDHALDPAIPLALAGRSVQIIHTPGHSAGGCCLHFAAERVLFSGDTLFASSIGRTDLPGGSLDELLHSIHDRLLSLPDDTIVYPGHGPSTTIGTERAHNPFLKPDGL